MMTDAEVADQIERADRFIADFREMIAATVVDPASLCADYQRRGLQRIADTLDAVPFVTMCNLANINAATLRKGTDGLAIVALVRRLDLDAVIITLAGQGRPAAIPILAKLPFDRNGLRTHAAPPIAGTDPERGFANSRAKVANRDAAAVGAVREKWLVCWGYMVSAEGLEPSTP